MSTVVLKVIRRVKQLLNKVESRLARKNPLQDFPYIKQRHQENVSTKLTHVSAFSYTNAGDTILPITVRDMVEVDSQKNFNWIGVNVHSTVTDDTIDIINKGKGLIIGGGGLFLKDTNPNNLSGWQWSCSIESLSKINVPIAVVAVGYNRFRNQDDFSSVFREHVNLLAQKSCFIGLRNAGSIKSMKTYIDPSQHHKIKFQPCPTTTISYLYPELVQSQKNKEVPFIALNCAFDRSNMRYGELIGEKLSSIARVIRNLSKDYEIRYYSHMETDKYFLPFLDAYKIPYKVVSLHVHPSEMVKLYSTPSLVIGMRGHAQMIPFGCQTPILSIISHEKMRYFLEDIQHEDWGCDIESPTFEMDLAKTAQTILNTRDNIVQEIKTYQEKLFNISKINSALITKEFKL